MVAIKLTLPITFSVICTTRTYNTVREERERERNACMVMFGVDSGQALLIFIVISRMFAGFVEPILLHSVGIQFQSILYTQTHE